MTQFEDVLETILEEYARRDSEGEFDTWEETDAFVKEKAEVLLAYVKEESVSKVWHDANEEPHDETKPMLVIAIDKTIHLWKGKIDTPEMRSAFCLCPATDINGETYSIVSKWAYIDDLLKL